MSKEGLGCPTPQDAALCNVVRQGKKACPLINECIKANANGDLSPLEFCKNNPGWTVDATIVFREEHIRIHPTDETPLKSGNIWFQNLSNEVWEKIVRERYEKEANQIISPKPPFT